MRSGTQPTPQSGTRARRIPVSGPWITEREIAYVTDAVAHAWYENANVYHQRFERAFCEYLGVRFAVALPSCTSALHLSLLALGIGPGDEVIVPDVTWVATGAAPTYVGATPVFADIDPQSWCVTAESVAACITPRTRAIIPVDLYGNMAPMPAIRALAAQQGIAVIEDAAEAMGAHIAGRRAGSFGDTGVFSFHGSKTMTTGEGGLLATDREDIYRRVLSLRDHGRDLEGQRMFWFLELGCKYKMSAMQAALGLAQLERIDELVQRKREIFEWYAAELAGVQDITINSEPPGTSSTYWMVTVVLDPALGITKQQLIEALADDNIDTRPFFYPLSSMPPFAASPEAEKASARNSVSYAISPYGINLPSGFDLTRETVADVCASLRAILRRG